MAKSSDLAVIIPHPGHGHLVAILEFINTLRRRNTHFSAAVLLINPPFTSSGLYAEKLSQSNPDITFVDIPRVDPTPQMSKSNTKVEFMSQYIESHKNRVSDAVGKLVESGRVNSTRFVIDMFSTSMIDVADRFRCPTYVFFTSSASFLGFTRFILSRPDTEFSLSEPDLLIPTYGRPVPASVIPTFEFDKAGHAAFVSHAKRILKTRGVIVNTFSELEPHALKSLSQDEEFPTVYAVGPILDLSGVNQELSGRKREEKDRIWRWLDEQDDETVAFLCFGCQGYFGAEQVKEIAIALENSGVRFLWSVRKSPEGAFKQPVDYEGPCDPILPKGFLSSIGNQGLVCGWVPQVEILAHKAIGGFVTHCGWNSILESIWFGVPMATWPLHGEQQLDAFDIVMNLELGIELSLDYRLGQHEVVRAEEIEKAVKCLMDREGKSGQVRKRVKEMAETSRAVVVKNGSSFNAIGQLIHDMICCIAILLGWIRCVEEEPKAPNLETKLGFQIS